MPRVTLSGGYVHTDDNKASGMLVVNLDVRCQTTWNPCARLAHESRLVLVLNYLA